MRFPIHPLCLAFCALLISSAAHAVPPAAPEAAREAATASSVAAAQADDPDVGGVEGLMNSGFKYIGIRYRMGGVSPETGFDCSGLVRRVFKDALGLDLPRTARELAGEGQNIPKAELKPGDLVFFNTMRKTFSHVGIYLGDNRFLHSPSKGGKVRVEEMDSTYWQKRFSGARRLVEGESAQPETLTR